MDKICRRGFFGLVGAALTGKALQALPQTPGTCSNVVQAGADLSVESLRQALADFAMMKAHPMVMMESTARGIGDYRAYLNPGDLIPLTGYPVYPAEWFPYKPTP